MISSASLYRSGHFWVLRKNDWFKWFCRAAEARAFAREHGWNAIRAKHRDN
jgi:hypothetical protein